MNEKQIKKFQSNLLNWYDQHKKPLPWRNDTEPYHIWISEIMSQQTQVETVIPYYERFMRKYPDVNHLAQADDAELLKMWEGLGYYSRARNLKLAAGQIMTDFAGEFPSLLSEILSLKGIGPYTAAAIASIAFGQAEPAIDGNLLRVTSRIFQLPDDISQSKSRKVFDSKLRELISADRPGDFNQALMDLGSTVCTPKNPSCEICPLHDFCQAFENKTQENFPIKTKKIKQKDLYFAAFALQNSLGEWYLEKRPARGLLANMWTFPLSALTENEFDQASRTGSLEKFPQLDEPILKVEFVQTLTHIFSHQKWHIALFKALPEEDFTVAEKPENKDKRWLSALTEIPLAGPQVKMFEILQEKSVSADRNKK